MSIIANIKHRDKTVEGCVVKVKRVWGSKVEGWNAVVSIFDKELTAEMSDFVVSAPWSDANPFPIVYQAAKEYMKTMKMEIVAENDEILKIVTPTPKKTKIKKE